jgi:DNA-binding helix-hairpin-helix protein with protein kinase domain
MGRHPYSGVPKTNEDIPIESAIRNGYYAYSQSSTTKLKPPPKVPSLNFLDTEIIEFFEKAFTFFPNKTPVRPSATDWKKLLESSLTKLKKCSNDSKHTFLAVAGSCPWCKLIAAESIMFFIPSKSNNSLSFVLPNLDEYRRKISAYQDHFKNKVFNHIIEINGILASPVIIPKNIKKPTQKPNTFPYPSLPQMPPEPELPPSDPWIEMLSLIFFMCSLLYALIDTKIGIISAIVFGVIFTAMRNAREQRENKMQKQLNLQQEIIIKGIMDNHQEKCKEVDKRNALMLNRWESENKEWSDCVKLWKNNLSQSKATTDAYKNQYSSIKSNTYNTAKLIIDYSLSLISKIEIISEDYTLQKQNAIVNSKKLQLETYLDSMLIRDAKLQSITNQRIIALESFGIESAKDVERLEYQKVPGIGEKSKERLFNWKAELSRNFRPIAGLPAIEMTRLNSKFAPALSPLKQEFENSIKKLSTINEEFFKQVADIESKLLQAKRVELTSEAYLTALHNL